MKGEGMIQPFSQEHLLGQFRWPSSQIQPSDLWSKQDVLVALTLACSPEKHPANAS